MNFKIFEPQGVALIMVLWIMVFLGLIASEFAGLMKTEVKITRNFKETAEAKALARAGVELAFAEILGDFDYAVPDENGETLLMKNDINLALGELPPDDIKAERSDIPLGFGNISYSIVDEERKININSATREQWIRLLELTGMEMSNEQAEILDSIEDWKDSDELLHLNGAESDYYMSLPEPYYCKNGKFDTVYELLMVKGVTTEILFGSEEDPEIKGIYPFLTTYGDGNVNFNTAPVEVLEIYKGKVEAANIMQIREENNGRYSNKMKSSTFRITASGFVDSISRAIQVVGKRSGSKDKSRVSILYWKDDFIESL